MFVVYKDDSEVIVTTAKREKKMLDLYFTKGERDPKDYNRSEISGIATVIETDFLIY